MSSQKPSASESDRRTQTRLSAQVPIQLRVGSESQTRPATLIDLSWGGALCQATTALPPGETRIWLKLPWASAETIDIEAQLLRQKDLEDGRHHFAVRFQRLSLVNQARLEKLLGHLQEGDAKGPPDHQAKPLVATLDVLIQTLDEWRGALSEIAKGQLRISAPVDFVPGQSLSLQFTGAPARARLRLRARILNREDPPQGFFEKAPARLTLEFEHPLDILRQWSEWLLRQIPPPDSASSPRADDQPQVAPPEAIKAQLIVSTVQRTALEAFFPESLDYLTTVWGDVDAFDSVFRRLIFGETDTLGTWTPEAWEELQFLQAVHDEAYGLPESRSIQLKPGRAR
ncbi:PilZ domain-containing protein [Thermochromatium tepidum]|uniref:PilZ domain-containing protein n=1 Tax=Thermochromatium tepidum ATCC 43061 TaxID=316276 RepID=A0A6I6E4T9_THETI|nr:PilZ domain-containing protein [Thermochromatium tepidum]QGU32832.1 hypothetical protein E6P07_07460 [Thermochromatium tepidum ATCC 43061]